jgi:hypothetical protein
MIPRTNVAGTEGVTRAGWARTSSKERWWCSIGCSLPPRGGVRCPTWCSAHSPRCGFLRPSVGFTQVSPTTKNCSNGRFRQHSSHFGSGASALEMRRAQAFGGSSPSASVVALQRFTALSPSRVAGPFSLCVLLYADQAGLPCTRSIPVLQPAVHVTRKERAADHGRRDPLHLGRGAGRPALRRPAGLGGGAGPQGTFRSKFGFGTTIRG